jgi:hypothetical protein
MHVAEFLDAFMFRPDVEIVEAFLPDVSRDVVGEDSLRRIASAPCLCQNASRRSQFESLHHGRRSLPLRFADQQMNMFGHDHVTGDDELIAPAHLLQHGQQQVTTVRGAEQRLPPIVNEWEVLKMKIRRPAA